MVPSVNTRAVAALLFLFSATAVAEDAQAKAAREELERQLGQMVGKQPTKVRVDFVALDDPNYRIEAATFELDGRSLGGPSLSELSTDGTHLVWNGDVSPGKHTVKVLLVISNGASVVLSDEGGYKWSLRGERSADVNSGIEVRVQISARRDGTQRDVAKRFKLATTAQPVMIAQLDDGKMPEAMAKPVIAIALVDAGVAGPTPEQVAAEEKKKAAEAAAEAKKQKAAEALEAKRLAAEAKQQKAAEAAEAKRLAAEAKKEKALAVAEAKRLAAEEKQRAVQELAEEKKRLAQAALDAKNPPAVVDAGIAIAVAEPLDAGAVEPVDAGAPVAVALAVVDAGSPAPIAATPSEGPPWVIIGIAGGLAALVFLVIVARRRSRPPTLDD